MIIMNKDIFKAYDIRGVYPSDLNAEDIKKIAKAYVSWLKKETGKSALRLAIGHDVRLSGPELTHAAIKGFLEMGVDVIDIGLISTDMLYFAVANYGFDGGISITASHNSGEYNGMKMVRENARPISIESGLAEIRDLAKSAVFNDSNQSGTVETMNILDDYVAKMISFVDQDKVRPLSAVVNPNFGASGVAIERIADNFGVKLTKINFVSFLFLMKVL